MPAPSQKGETGFPVKTALAMATIAAVLTLWHWRLKQPTGLDWSIAVQVAKLPFLERPKPTPVTPGIRPGVPEPFADALQPPDALLIDNDGSMYTFYAALARLDRHVPLASATVVHFGDSPTTADLITGDVREQLQQRFGDAGQGFNLIAKPWAWYQHRHIDESDHGWKFTTAVGTMRQGGYGIGGAWFDGSAGATTEYRLSDAAQDAMEVMWETQPDGGTFSVSADGQSLATIDTTKAAESGNSVATGKVSDSQPAATSAEVGGPGMQFRSFKLPPNKHKVDLTVEKGNVRLYGVLFKRDQSGVLYNSIGLNGASITVLSRALPEDMMKTNLAHLHADLIVINYGTNEAGFSSFIDKRYEGELRMAIARVRQAAPEASILLMSPMDRGERGAGNSIDTMQTIPKIVDIQERVAADTGCAFFNTFEAMGGEGTMQRWYDAKPRLVGGDLIHPTPAGAKIVATAFVEQLEDGYLRYQKRGKANVAGAPPAAKPSSSTSPDAAHRAVQVETNPQ
jgi:lysophospholipase L1-like esterase